MIEKLIWDSSFFGYPVGRIYFESPKNIDLKSLQLQSKDYKLVYVFSKEELIDERFQLVDEKVTLTKNIYNSSSQLIYKYCQPFHDSEINFEQLLELAYLSGQYSRYRLDPNFVNDEFKRLYNEWINKSLKKEIAIETIVVTDQGILKGFISLNKKDEKTSKIGLIAVNTNFQGQGVGSQLLQDVELLSSHLGLNTIQVDTQMLNSAGMKLYLNNGYTISNVVKIYHLWNK